MISTLFLLMHLAADLIETCYVTERESTIIGFLLIVYPIRPKKRLLRSQTVPDLWLLSLCSQKVKGVKKTLLGRRVLFELLMLFLRFPRGNTPQNL